MRTITISSAYVRQTLEGARKQGYDLERLLRDCGIAPQVLAGDRSRVEASKYFSLLKKLTSLMNDEAMGLLEKPQRIGTSELLSNGVISCETVGEAYEKSAQYANLFENGFSHRVTLDDTYLSHEMSRRLSADTCNPYIIETTLMTYHRFHSWLAGDRLPVVEVNLDYSPTDYLDEYRFLFFGVPVRFNQPVNSLVYKAECSGWPVIQNSQTLKGYLSRSPYNLFETRESEQLLSIRIRSLLEEHLNNQQELLSIEEVASHFEMHSQSLRRQLKKERVVYQELKTEVRRDMAIYLLNRKGVSVEDIAGQLAFSEPSAFIRAFKQWTGLTPLNYKLLLIRS
ncbi:hypothetical protein EOPP23_12820 [Endozoicomonas sp. OPT23]|uniref:AraC family transcriptional regulator n=1 Tax=Endozoicomonas sp. OPT23 TaxID=2072845 RepID=UPI00129A2E51|nr:AraC family transcriptional regulator [Endozoicomonas sp. OPT23]MRI33870.1 hypothetical protein [Endozoicomonas sp. OPT23]